MGNEANKIAQGFSNNVSLYANSYYSWPYLQTRLGIKDEFNIHTDDKTQISGVFGLNQTEINTMTFPKNLSIRSADRIIKNVFYPKLNGVFASIGGNAQYNPHDNGWCADVSAQRNINLKNLIPSDNKTSINGTTVDANLGYRFLGAKKQSTEIGMFGYKNIYDKLPEFNQNSLGLYSKYTSNNFYLKGQLGLDPTTIKNKFNGGVSFGLKF